jgi:hypothetical protein
MVKNGSQLFYKMKNAPRFVNKGFQLPASLYEKTLAIAKSENRSFSYIVRRAMQREIEAAGDGEKTLPEFDDALIPIGEVAQMLKLSISRVRTRSRKKGDPIRAARSKVAKLKPMHFHRHLIEEMSTVKQAT